MSHRLPMARAARDAGFEVHVATRVDKSGDAIRAEGFTLHHVPFARGRVSPLHILNTIVAVRKIHAAIRPAISHHVALQPTVLASIASIGRDVVCLNALTGLGFVFTSKTARARLMRPILSGALRFLLDRGADISLVQNPDDRAALRALGVPDHRIALISGSGVDLDQFAAHPEPPAPIVVGFASRLLLDKGVHTLVEAHRILRARGFDIRLRIAGDRDVANPTSISSAQLARWRDEPGVELLGHVTDMPSFWARVHIAALPSRREGLPKTLVEAAACGRPAVASDVPGCREVVIPGQTGLLVAVDDPHALADALARLATEHELRRRLGIAARARAESTFAASVIAREITELYDQLLRSRAA